MISEISRNFQDENNKLKEKIEEIQVKFYEKEQKIIDKCEILKASTESMEKKTGQYVLHIEKLNEYIDDLRRRNEEEINIRKQFEAKLNELHSVGRDQDTKYYRALEEIDDFMQKLLSTDNRLKKFEKEAMDLRKVKINLETELVNIENKCKSLVKENININRMLAQKEKRITELENENHKIKQEIITSNKLNSDLTLSSNIMKIKEGMLYLILFPFRKAYC